MNILIIFLIIVFPLMLGLGSIVMVIWMGVRTTRSVPREVRTRRRAQQKADYAQPHNRPRYKTVAFVLLFSGCAFLLFSLLVIWSIFSSYFYANQFRAGRCTIISKMLAPEQVTVVTGSHEEYNSTTDKYETVEDTARVPGYRPTFDVTLHMQDSKATARVHAPDVFGEASENKKQEQAILDHYEQGASYSCWYYPPDPTQLTFSRPSTALNLAFLIPFFLCFTLGMICLTISLRAFYPGKIAG